MRSEREEKLLEQLIALYQSTVGIVVWGEIEGAAGTYAQMLVKSDGTVKVEGIATVSGSVDITDDWTRQLGQVDLQRYLGSAIGATNPLHSQIVVSGAVVDPRDVSDRAARLLGKIYGDQGVLTQRVSSLDLYVQLRNAGSEIDPRSIRALVKTTDELYSVLRTDAGVAYDARDRSWNLGSSDVPDVSDRAARLLGKIYGSQGQVLLQRASTYESVVQLSHQGTEYDGRQIRSLTSADVVDIYDKWARQLGLVDLSRVLGAALSASNPVIVGVYDASGNRMPSMDSALRPGYGDIIDRAGRLVGVVYGNQAQLQQRTTSNDLFVALRQGGSELSTTNPIFAGVVDASGNRMPSMDASTRPGYVDIIDRAARLVGVVYGNVGQLQQRATSLDLYTALRQGGSELSTTNPIFAGIVDASGNRMPSMDTSSRPGYVTVVDVTKVVSTPAGSGAGYLTPQAIGAGAALTIVNAPGSGYKLRLKGIQISVDAATRIDLRWDTTAFRSYYLPVNGSIERNFVDDNYEGGNNAALTIASTVACNITASASTEKLAV